MQSNTINPMLLSKHTQKMQTERLNDAAVKLEATFIAEMLKSAGLYTSPQDFGGGIGEEQFNSFVMMEYATKIAESGGIGLAESIYKSLTRSENV